MKSFSVVFVLARNMLASSVTLPLEQLRAAEALARVQHRSFKIQVEFVSEHGNDVITHSGIKLAVTSSLKNAIGADLIYLPALWRNPWPVLEQNYQVIEFLKTCFEQNPKTIFASASTGAYFLAKAKLLRGRPATTHWAFFDDFSQRFPNILLKRQHFIVQAGNIFTSGSVNSLADITSHLISTNISKETANHVERHFFHEIRQNFDSQQRFDESVASHPDELIADIQASIEASIDSITIKRLARDHGISVRTLNRRFKVATNTTPLQFIQKKRVELASQLLKNTNLDIGEILMKVGYVDASHFISIFKKSMGVGPSEYRKTVRAKLFT